MAQSQFHSKRLFLHWCSIQLMSPYWTFTAWNMSFLIKKTLKWSLALWTFCRNQCCKPSWGVNQHCLYPVFVCFAGRLGNTQFLWQTTPGQQHPSQESRELYRCQLGTESSVSCVPKPGVRLLTTQLAWSSSTCSKILIKFPSESGLPPW